MAEEYYQILGVARDATEVEIKKRYKKLALKHHPDKGGDAETFKKISEAAAVLTDPSQRRAYDDSGMDNAGFGQEFPGFAGAARRDRKSVV